MIALRSSLLALVWIGIGLLPSLVHAEPAVIRSAFARAVVDREPAQVDVRFGADVDRVYYFTELEDLAGHQVTHRWYYRGEEMAAVSFRVEGPRWRVWSSKAMLPGWGGNWTVEVEDEDGHLLHSDSFLYGEP